MVLGTTLTLIEIGMRVVLRNNKILTVWVRVTLHACLIQMYHGLGDKSSIGMRVVLRNNKILAALDSSNTARVLDLNVSRPLGQKF